jgi:hypothetical protein
MCDRVDRFPQQNERSPGLQHVASSPTSRRHVNVVDQASGCGTRRGEQENLVSPAVRSAEAAPGAASIVASWRAPAASRSTTRARVPADQIHSRSGGRVPPLLRLRFAQAGVGRRLDEQAPSGRRSRSRASHILAFDRPTAAPHRPRRAAPVLCCHATLRGRDPLRATRRALRRLPSRRSPSSPSRLASLALLGSLAGDRRVTPSLTSTRPAKPLRRARAGDREAPARVSAPPRKNPRKRLRSPPHSPPPRRARRRGPPPLQGHRVGDRSEDRATGLRSSSQLDGMGLVDARPRPGDRSSLLGTGPPRRDPRPARQRAPHSWPPRSADGEPSSKTVSR